MNADTFNFAILAGKNANDRMTDQFRPLRDAVKAPRLLGKSFLGIHFELNRNGLRR